MKGIQKFSAMIMSALLLLSTITWTVDTHFCMGRTMDVAFFAKADTCGMELLLDEGEENHCCDHETVVLEGQDDLKTTNVADDVFKPAFVLANATPFYSTIQGDLLVPVVLNGYPPPENLRVIDRNILYETFLI